MPIIVILEWPEETGPDQYVRRRQILKRWQLVPSQFESILRSGDPEVPETIYVGARARRWSGHGWDRYFKSRRKGGSPARPPAPVVTVEPVEPRRRAPRKRGRKPATQTATPPAE
jgi:hypothetical protein